MHTQKSTKMFFFLLACTSSTSGSWLSEKMWPRQVVGGAPESTGNSSISTISSSSSVVSNPISPSSTLPSITTSLPITTTPSISVDTPTTAPITSLTSQTVVFSSSTPVTSSFPPSSSSIITSSTPVTTSSPITSSEVSAVTSFSSLSGSFVGFETVTDSKGSQTSVVVYVTTYTSGSSVIAATATASLQDASGSSGDSEAKLAISKGAIIGICVGIGGAIILGALAAVAWRVWGRKKRHADEYNELMATIPAASPNQETEYEKMGGRYGKANTAANF